MLQVQSTRFIYNWRRHETEDKYPRFKVLLPVVDPSVKTVFHGK